MLSQYKKYKAKNLSKEALKQQRKREVKAKAVPAQALIESLNKTTEKLKGLDATSLTDTEKTTLSTVMTHLKTTITATLKFLTQKSAI